MNFAIFAVNLQFSFTISIHLGQFISFFHFAQETGVLFLPRKFHFATAVMLVEVYGSCVPDGPGGLNNLEYENAGILSQVNWRLYFVL